MAVNFADISKIVIQILQDVLFISKLYCYRFIIVVTIYDRSAVLMFRRFVLVICNCYLRLLQH